MTAPSSAPEVAARPAGPADTAAVVELAAALRLQMADQRGGPLWAAHDAHPSATPALLDAWRDDPDHAVLVGTIDGHVVAYGIAHSETVPTVGLLGVVDELYVLEAARAVSIGETLLEALVAWCRTAGCVGVDATALPGDRQAKNFFESAGFKARRLIMHTDLT